MRVTVCELPHEPHDAARAWAQLREHTVTNASELVLLPEFAMVEPLWESDRFDLARWVAAERLSRAWLERLVELGVRYVVGTRPRTIRGRRLNQGFLWSAEAGIAPLRSKFHMPTEPGCWETRWFDRGDPSFPAFQAGDLTFGLNICTELWALETYTAYASSSVQAIMMPRATAAATTAKWLAVGVVAAVRSGAYSLSSNRVDASGASGGVGWIVSPDGRLMARTTAEEPFATVGIDLAVPTTAREEYPRYVFDRVDATASAISSQTASRTDRTPPLPASRGE